MRSLAVTWKRPGSAHHAFEHRAGPAVADRRLDRRHAAAGLGQPLGGPGPIAAAIAVGLRQQGFLQIAVGVQQQPPEQAARQGAASRRRRPAASLELRVEPPAEGLGKGQDERARPWRSDWLRPRPPSIRPARRRRLACTATTGTPSRSWSPANRCDAAAGSHVDHVDGHDRRQPQFQDLAEQIEIALEVAGIDQANDGVHRRADSSRRPSKTSTATISSRERGARL